MAGFRRNWSDSNEGGRNMAICAGIWVVRIQAKVVGILHSTTGFQQTGRIPANLGGIWLLELESGDQIPKFGDL
jgi:hypothetical protein